VLLGSLFALPLYLARCFGAEPLYFFLSLFGWMQWYWRALLHGLFIWLDTCSAGLYTVVTSAVYFARRGGDVGYCDTIPLVARHYGAGQIQHCCHTPLIC
jgi:hypothetical protein